MLELKFREITEKIIGSAMRVDAALSNEFLGSEDEADHAEKFLKESA